MRNRILWLGLSFLVVAALVLASCAKEEVVTPGEQEEEEEEEVVTPGEEEEEEVVTPAAGEPVYGGTLTFALASRANATDPQGPDLMDGGRSQLDFLQAIQENPIRGDFEKYGPRGTNEFPFLLRPTTPIEYCTTGVLESWEMDDEEMVWHVRPGIYWQGRDVTESRELTADDVAAWLLYYRSTPAEAAFKAATTAEITATDRYTVVVPLSAGYNVGAAWLALYEDRALVVHPDNLGSDTWEDYVGTGPFMLKEYVRGSFMSFDRNPDYWGTTTINGVEYEIPFVDELIYPIIADYDTQIAALRTGKLDFMDSVTVTYWESLDTTAPRLESRRYVSTGVTSVGFRNDLAPFNNIEVRKALMIGTDIRAFRALIKSGAEYPMPVNPWPFYAEDPYYYIPLEELPEENRLLYSYNPTLARQMLTAQGIPTGFKIILEMTPGDQTVVALVKDQWAKIGIDLQIVILEYPVLWAKTGTANKTYTQAIFAGWESGDPVSMLSAWVRTGARQNDTVYNNPTVDALIDQMNGSRDRAEQKRLAKEALTIMRDDVPMIPLMSGTQAHFWWPWLKNYYGEVNVGDWCNTVPIMASTWIDQDMKADMGFK